MLTYDVHQSTKVLLLLLGVAIASCDGGSDPNSTGQTHGPGQKKKTSIRVDGKDGDSTKNSSSGDAEDGDEEKEGEEENDSSSNNNNSNDIAKRAKAGRSYFTETVEPQFQESCDSCHAEPRFDPDPAGPLSIFDYGLMRAHLSQQSVSGSHTALNNKLMDKTRAQVAHAGGSACGTNVSGPPCNVIMEWWEIEFGNGEASNEAGLAGEIESVSVTGTLYGYAASVLDKDKTLSVDFYVGGDKDTGTKLFATPVEANKSGYAGGVQGNHRFQVNIPGTYADGQTRPLHVYALIDGSEQELKGSPFDMRAWTPKGNTAFYNNKFTGCGCHSRTYQGDYGVLGSPSPNDGGSRTNNKLYQVGSGGHSGGGYDTTFVSDWWDFEFGQ